MVDGILNSGDEVIVDGELYITGQPTPNTNNNSYWALVFGYLGGNIYCAKDTLGNSSIIDKNHLCLCGNDMVFAELVFQMTRKTTDRQCSISPQRNLNGSKNT